MQVTEKKVTYDEKTRALYIYMVPKTGVRVAHSQTLDAPEGFTILADLDVDGNTIGIEILMPTNKGK